MDAKPDLIARLQQLPMPPSLAALGGARGEPRVLRRQPPITQHPGAAGSTLEVRDIAIGVANDVQSRVRAYGDVLYAIRGLFDSSNNVTAKNSTGSRKRFRSASVTQGHQHFFFAARVPHAKKLQFERAVRAEKKPPGQRAARILPSSPRASVRSTWY